MPYVRRFGCCSSGPAFGSNPELDYGGESILSNMEPGFGDVTVTVPDPGAAQPPSFLHIFAVSVAAGLTIHFLTRKKR